MASELTLVLYFEGPVPTEEDIVEKLDCDVIEYIEQEV